MCDLAERDDRVHARHRRDLRHEEIPAGADFFRRRLVFRRHAANGIDDAGIDELEAIVGSRRVKPARKTEVGERLIEKIAGIVAGEGPAGAVGAAQARRQSNDEKPRLARPERGNRCVEPAGLCRAVGLAKCDEARAAWAVVARAGKLGQPAHRRQRGRHFVQASSGSGS